jgi:hypothetical protein
MVEPKRLESVGQVCQRGRVWPRGAYLGAYLAQGKSGGDAGRSSGEAVLLRGGGCRGRLSVLARSTVRSSASLTPRSSRTPIPASITPSTLVHPANARDDVDALADALVQAVNEDTRTAVPPTALGMPRTRTSCPNLCGARRESAWERRSRYSVTVVPQPRATSR